MKKFIGEFKEFISRGNVMDMAIGVIIGASFKAIVDSLVADIINPILGLFGGKDFSQYVINLPGDATLNYGKFISAIINFVIMAFIIFCIVKFLNSMNDLSAKLAKKKAEEEMGWVAEYGIKEMCEDSWRWQSNNPNGYEN